MGAYQKFLEQKKQKEIKEQKNIEVKEEVQEIKNVNEENKYKIVELNLNELDYYKNQPFKEYNQDEMNNLKESIERIGLQNAIVVRKKENNRYEILSGNNRVRVFKELNKETIPARVVECDDNKAELIMIDSNIVQRNELSVMERAKAYKLKQELMKKVKLNKDEIFNKEEQELLNQTESQRTFFRYISLNNLIEEYQNMCDKKEISIPVGEILSTLSTKTQKNILEVTKNKKLTMPLVKKIKQSYQESENNNVQFDINKIEEILNNKKEKDEKKTLEIKFNDEELNKYFKGLENSKEIKDYLIELVKESKNIIE